MHCLQWKLTTFRRIKHLYREGIVQKGSLSESDCRVLAPMLDKYRTLCSLTCESPISTLVMKYIY